MRRGRAARPAGAPVMRKLERSQQSNGTRAAEAQRAHLTSSNLLSAASICVGGAFRCCTRGTGFESLAATRPGSDVGFPSRPWGSFLYMCVTLTLHTSECEPPRGTPGSGARRPFDGQRMVTLTDTPLTDERERQSLSSRAILSKDGINAWSMLASVQATRTALTDTAIRCHHNYESLTVQHS